MPPADVYVAASVLLGLYAAMLAAAVFGQRLLAFPWWIDLRKTPDVNMLVAGFEEVEIVTADGERLKAFWLPPRGDAPVILTLHGIRGFHWLNALRFAAGRWAEGGYGILAPAFRGYHGSTGWPHEEGLIADAQAALAFARERAPSSETVIHGHSLGSGVAVATAARSGCKTLILEAAFTSLPDVGARWYPFFPVRRFMRDRFPTLALIKVAKAERIFMLHGTADRLVPMAMAKEVAAARDGVRFMPIEGYGHTGFQQVADELLQPFFGADVPEALTLPRQGSA